VNTPLSLLMGLLAFWRRSLRITITMTGWKTSRHGESGRREEFFILSILSLPAALRSFVHAGAKVWCKVCSLCDYTPVAGRDRVSEVLAAEHESAHQRLKRVAGIDSRVAEGLWTYQLPGHERASINEVAALRRDDDAGPDSDVIRCWRSKKMRLPIVRSSADNMHSERWAKSLGSRMFT
jgi:hypothetical protein